MPSSTDNVKLGVCNVFYDGVDLGYTKGGVEVEVSTSTYEVTVDQFGATPINDLITGRTVTVTVPLAETTLENMLRIMPGSTLVTDGVKATGSLTFASAPPVNSDKIEFPDGTVFTFKTTPAGPFDLAIPASINAAATAIASAINNANIAWRATANGPVVNLEAREMGVAGNGTITKTFATSGNLTVVNLTGGVDPTAAKVVVATGVNTSLLSVAKKLVLRPIGTNGEDDFIVHRAACPGALSFSYQTEAERIFTAAFKGYVDADGSLFTVGDETAVA